MNCNYKVKITDIQTKYKFKVFCTGYDDSEIKEKVDAIYQAFPKTTAEGETPTLDNTANALMTIDLKGNTSQETTTGKNMLGLTNGTYTHNGVTAVVLDGKVTVNGTATATSFISIPLVKNIDLSNQTVTLSINNTTTAGDNLTECRVYTSSTGYLPCSFSSINNSATFTNRTDNYVSVQIRTSSEATYNNFVFYPMLESGSSATAYEPYTNGASPNPDYPQTVHTVSGDNTIEIVGKNSYSSVMEYGTINNSTGENGTASTTQIRTQDYIEVIPSTAYTLWNNNNYSQYVYEYKSDKTFIGYLSTNTKPPFTFTTNSETKYIKVRTVASETANDLTTKFMLVKGSTAGDYEPYQSQSYAVNLGTMELCKIGDYQDYIYKENKKWYKYGAIGKTVLNGTESNWGISQTSGFYRVAKNFISEGIYKYTDTSRHIDKFICSHFNKSTTNAIGITYQYETQLYFYPTSDITTVELWKTWLSSHNTTVYYVLATPTTTEITDATLISQLNALAGAESYSGQTNISQTNDDKPFILTAKALKDLSNL